MNQILNSIIKASEYKLTQFSTVSIDAVEKNIIMKQDKKGNDVAYVRCLVRNKDIKLTPEELVRQLYIYKLVHEYGYPVERMELERAISFGREKKRADILIKII